MKIMKTIYVDSMSMEENQVNMFKNLKNGLQYAENDDSIFLNTGTYEIIQLNSLNRTFKLFFQGTGSNVILGKLYLCGFFWFTFENLKLSSMFVKIKNSQLHFMKTFMKGFNTMEFEESTNNVLHFTEVIFNQSFQIIIKGGNHEINFDNCIFKGNYPVCVINNGNLKLK